MRRPPLPVLLLLPLLAVLLFGNCGGGVRQVVDYMGQPKRDEYQKALANRQAQRAAARQNLRGRARRDEYLRIHEATEARLHELMSSSDQQRKMQHRRRKLERQLRNYPVDVLSRDYRLAEPQAPPQPTTQP